MGLAVVCSRSCSGADTGSIRVRTMIIMTSAPGTLVPAIARLLAADEDTVRDVVPFYSTSRGWLRWTPLWAGRRPRLNSDSDIQVIVTAVTGADP
jgi:hypothetical protein